ncbi:MAG: cadherin-like beta sandwich domain-containing protein [Nitrospira sp.]
MKHPLNSAASRYLAAALLVALGLSTYGCSDTGTLNPEVELSRLTVSPGTLQPGFSGGTTSYRVDLTSNIASVIVTAQAAVSGDTVTIDGQATTSRTITLDPAGSTTVVNIVVSESTNNSRTYTIRLIRAGLVGDNSLQSLSVSSGTLAPAFDANVQSYSVSVANSVASINVTPTLSDPAATFTVNGQAAFSGQARAITLNGPGQSTSITIIVTAQNGNDKAYVVAVGRGISANNNLQGLAISPGALSPAFSAGTVGYTVNVATSVTSVTVTPSVQDNAASMTVNGQVTNSGQAQTITLNGPGANTFINIIVNPQNGPSKTYSVNVVRAALAGTNNLSALTVSPGPLSPTFNSGAEDYSVSVATSVTTVTVTPTLQNSSSTMTVNGTPTTSGQAHPITLRAAGLSTLINIVVTAQNGAQRTYTVEVERAALGGNNNLSALNVSPGPLVPAFAQSTLTYTVNVANTVTSVNVSATKADANAVMSEDVTAGAGTATGQASIQLGGEGTATVVLIAVTASNGTSKTYRITVNRTASSNNNNLSALAVSPGSLTPSFAAGTEDYAVHVATDVTSMNVSATKADANAVMSGSVSAGTGVPTGQTIISLNEAGTSTFVSITVTAANGRSKTYSITVNRAANEDEGNNGGNRGNGSNRGNGGNNGNGNNGNEEDD